ncbi:MAG: glycosyltransferase family 39 protein [Actinobacteria bacterium]|nr:glycosyltransferase family 39 protein [Actinomycetota bacterium]
MSVIASWEIISKIHPNNKNENRLFCFIIPVIPADIINIITGENKIKRFKSTFCLENNAAYSILETGRDEHGKFLPVTLESVGDYKNPVQTYLMIPGIKLLGLNDFSIRLPNALISTMTIPIFFFFLLNIFKNKRHALLGTTFLAFSSWHIFYSRFAYEPLMASTFILLGIWFFMKMLDGPRFWAILSAFFLMLTMYTAAAPRLFIPVFIITALAFNVKKLKSIWGRTLIFLITCTVLGLPLVYVSIFQGANTRLGMVLLSKDIEFLRYINIGPVNSIPDFFLLIFFWLKRYLSYFQPDFIFLNSLGMTPQNSFGLGLLYLFELPFVLLGIIEFIHKKIPYKSIFVIWLFTGIFPDSITNNQQHSGRVLQIAPVLVLISILGAIRFFTIIKKLPKPYLKMGIIGSFSALVIINFIHAFLSFNVYYPRVRGESIDVGAKEAIEYVVQNQNKYKAVVFDTRRGTDGPYQVTNLFLYLLFYSRYDPHIYQTEPKINGTKEAPLYKFNKYSFRYINWQTDHWNKDTLYIGSPWSFPSNISEIDNVLTKIYMKDGLPAYYIVTPR